MVESRRHESPEEIEAHLRSCLVFARRLCLDTDERLQVGGLKLLRQLYRARRNGRMTPELKRKYEGLLRYVRPHVRGMSRRGVRIPAVVEAELERVHDEGRP